MVDSTPRRFVPSFPHRGRRRSPGKSGDLVLLRGSAVAAEPLSVLPRRRRPGSRRQSRRGVRSSTTSSDRRRHRLREGGQPARPGHPGHDRRSDLRPLRRERAVPLLRDPVFAQIGRDHRGDDAGDARRGRRGGDAPGWRASDGDDHWHLALPGPRGQAPRVLRRGGQSRCSPAGDPGAARAAGRLRAITDLYDAVARSIGLHVESMDDEVRRRWMPGKWTVSMDDTAQRGVTPGACSGTTTSRPTCLSGWGRRLGHPARPGRARRRRQALAAGVRPGPVVCADPRRSGTSAQRRGEVQLGRVGAEAARHVKVTFLIEGRCSALGRGDERRVGPTVPTSPDAVPMRPVPRAPEVSAVDVIVDRPGSEGKTP